MIRLKSAVTACMGCGMIVLGGGQIVSARCVDFDLWTLWMALVTYLSYGRDVCL